MNRFFILFLISLSSFVSNASVFPTPKMDVILSVSGAIHHTNLNRAAQFDREMLEQFPQTQVVTLTPWTDTLHRYDGVLLTDLLDQLQAEGNRVVAKGLNGYQAELNMEILSKYPVIIAIKTDGEYMRVRDKGPLWLILPLSDYPELDTTLFHEDMVWQLHELVVY